MIGSAVGVLSANTADRVRNTHRGNTVVRCAVAGARTLLTDTTDLADIACSVAVVGAIGISDALNTHRRNTVIGSAISVVSANTADRVRNTLRVGAIVRRAVAGASTLLTDTTDLTDIA